MRSRRSIAAVTLGVCLSLSATAAAVSTPKKGVGTWSFTGEAQAMTSVGATWFYTWGTTSSGNTVPSDVAFVPMIWGSADVTTANLDEVKTESSVLLGFNEPDQSGQSNMTPAQALDLWPQLVATGMRLGSPAVSANAQMAGGWLDTFMSGAQSQGLRVDFICLHWYGGNFDPTSAVSELESYVEQTHAKYNLPIWVTEFALTNFGATVTYPTETQMAEFASGAVDMLEDTSYVERYAWFALPPCDATGSSSCAAGNTRPLALDGGTLTSVGVAYAGAGPDGGTTAADASASDAATGPTGSGSDDAAPGLGSGSDATAAGDATISAPDDEGGSPSTSFEGGGGGGGDGGASTGASKSSGGGCSCELAGRTGRTGGISGIAMALSGALAILARRTRRRHERRQAP
jgi:hypothetical protein